MPDKPSARVRVIDCGNGDDCPALDPGADGGIEVTGTPVDRPGLPAGEAVVWVPRELLPEVADLTIENLGSWIGARHERDLLRVQTRTRYAVASDGDDYARYRAGASEPAAAGKGDWLTRLATDAARGRRRRNVHIVEQPLSDYLRYQFEWCYVPNVEAGQDVRVLDVTTHPAAAHLAACGDFTVVEGAHVAGNRYASDGAFLGAVQASVDAAVAMAALAEAAWSLAVPFLEWWRAHPQYHRVSTAA